MLFKRQIQVIAGHKKINYPPMTIDFEIDFDNDPEPNLCTCYLVNLSDDTINRIKRSENIIISAGYENDMGTVWMGRIEEIYTENFGVDRETVIESIDIAGEWLEVNVNKTYKPGTTAQQVFRDLLQSHALTVKPYSLPSDTTYNQGLSISAPLQDALKNVAADCGAEFYVVDGVFYVGRNPEEVTIAVNTDSGLLGLPERIEDEEGDRWKIRTLFNHRIRPGSRIKLESQRIAGMFTAVRGRHLGGRAHVTEMEVAE